MNDRSGFVGVAQTRPDDDGLIDLAVLFSRFLAKKWWIIASVVGFAFAFGCFAFTARPTYRVTTVLAAASSDASAGIVGAALGQLGGLASVMGINASSKAGDIEEALAVLRSRQFIASFIEDEHLLPKLFPKKWDSAAGKWKVDKPRQPTLAKGYKYFVSRVCTVDQDKKTRLVALQIDWTDRNEAALWANSLVVRLNNEMRRRAIVLSQASISFLEKEMQTASEVATRDAIGRLIEAQIKQRMLANVTLEYTFRVVDKALPPDGDDPVAPRKVRIVAAGAVTGLLLSMLWIVVADAWRAMAVRIAHQAK